MKTVVKVIFIFSIFAGVRDLQAACIIRNSDGQPTITKHDALFTVLQSAVGCPQNVQGLKSALKKTGLKTQPSTVANRGIHNPAFGSFSFFEEVISENNQDVQIGELFFGHFTDAINGVLVLDQKPAPNKLMIELIAWDQQKKFYNFYELIGTTSGGQWFYRGDSADILKDNENIYLETALEAPKFGSHKGVV